MKAGLIGCGGIANVHMGVWTRAKGVEVVGVCDLNIDRAKAVARRFRIKRVFTSYDDLLDLKPDVVDICTPVSTHADIACSVAKSVPAIFLEKPMAINTTECDRMIETMKKFGTKLCVGHNQLFLPSIEKAKLLVDNGDYELLSFRTSLKESFELLKSYGFMADWMVSSAQRGIIWESGCHLAYLQLHFLGDIKEVYAVGGKSKFPVYDNFAVLLRTDSSRFGIIELSWLSKETAIVYEIGDAKGKRMEIYRDFDYLVENSALPPHTIRGVLSSFAADEKRVLGKWAKFDTNYIKKKKLVPHTRLISAFIFNIGHDLPPPVSGRDGRNAVHLLECIEKSLDEHKAVPVRLLKGSQ